MDDPNVVSPGILGFLAFFFLAVALYLLVRNMNGHLRRVRYRAEQMEAEEKAAEEKASAPESEAPEQAPEPDAPGSDQDQDHPA